MVCVPRVKLEQLEFFKPDRWCKMIGQAYELVVWIEERESQVHAEGHDPLDTKMLRMQREFLMREVRRLEWMRVALEMPVFLLTETADG